MGLIIHKSLRNIQFRLHALPGSRHGLLVSRGLQKGTPFSRGVQTFIEAPICPIKSPFGSMGLKEEHFFQSQKCSETAIQFGLLHRDSHICWGRRWGAKPLPHPPPLLHPPLSSLVYVDIFQLPCCRLEANGKKVQH